MNCDYLGFVIYELFQWRGRALKRPLDQVSFTRLELMKLLFFVSAIRVDDNDLLDCFSEFYAMQLGPVEIPSYNRLVNNEIPCCVSERMIVRLASNIESYRWTSDAVTSRIERSLSKLESVNPNLIRYPAYKLVEISHVWRCWKVAIEIANVLGKNSIRMSVDSIRSSNHYFGI